KALYEAKHAGRDRSVLAIAGLRTCVPASTGGRRRQRSSAGPRAHRPASRPRATGWRGGAGRNFAISGENYCSLFARASPEELPAMKKIITDANVDVDEAVDVIIAAHPSMLKAVSEDHRAIARADAPIKGHVGIVTGGGSGHLPLFLGYVGVGLCTAVAVGNVFSSPSAEQILAATRASHGGAGVLYLYGNYGGDVMNFDLAGELAADEIETDTVGGVDAVASAPPAR